MIIGLKELNAGKTTLARALLLYLRERGVDACGFKPKAGNSVWYDYDVVHESLSHGKLYGKDAKLLKETSGTKLAEEVINPVHRLWAEPPHLHTASQVPNFIVDRVTLCDEHVRNIVVMNRASHFDYEFDELLKNLLLQPSKVYEVNSLEDLNKITEKYYDCAVESAYAKVAGNHEAIVVEGYSDIAIPWGRFGKLDLVLGVEPGRISAYSPDKYLTAVTLSTQLRGEVASNHIRRLLKPLKQVKVPPSKSQEAVKKMKETIPKLLEI